MKAGRIRAVVIRQTYLYRRSLPRLMEIFYWPVLDLVLWGFITLYLAPFREAGLPDFVTFFLGALILWDILFRSQLGVSVSFLEDVWARNFLSLFVSPLTPGEYIIALMLVSAGKIVLAAAVMSLLAWLLYSFNVFVIGISLLPLVLNLVAMGWAIGIVTLSLILRFGQQAEILAWGIAIMFQPVSAVFYPVAVLPPILRAVARAVPASYVFEGMRRVISGGGFPADMLLRAAGLNVLYIGAALLFFRRIFRTVKRKGLLVRIGE